MFFWEKGNPVVVDLVVVGHLVPHGLLPPLAVTGRFSSALVSLKDGEPHQ